MAYYKMKKPLSENDLIKIFKTNTIPGFMKSKICFESKNLNDFYTGINRDFEITESGQRVLKCRTSKVLMQSPNIMIPYRKNRQIIHNWRVGNYQNRTGKIVLILEVKEIKFINNNDKVFDYILVGLFDVNSFKSDLISANNQLMNQISNYKEFEPLSVMTKEDWDTKTETYVYDSEKNNYQVLNKKFEEEKIQSKDIFSELLEDEIQPNYEENKVSIQDPDAEEGNYDGKNLYDQYVNSFGDDNIDSDFEDFSDNIENMGEPEENNTELSKEKETEEVKHQDNKESKREPIILGDEAVIEKDINIKENKPSDILDPDNLEEVDDEDEVLDSYYDDLISGNKSLADYAKENREKESNDSGKKIQEDFDYYGISGVSDIKETAGGID